jgi:chromosome segregation ATPase
MGFVLSLLTNKVTWIFLAFAVVAMVFGVQQMRITSLKSTVAERDATISAARSEIASTKVLIAQWKTAYDTLTKTVDTQNAAIAQLELEVAKRTARVKEVLRLAEVARKEANGLAESIQLMEVAKDECTSMRQLIDAYTAGMQ